MTLTRCRQIITAIPGYPPIDNGAVIHDGAVILDIGSYTALKKSFSGKITDMGDVTLVPGLVNAHCHLNLSKLKGKTRSGRGFVPWLLSMIANDYKTTDFNAVSKSVADAAGQGTCCFGDILNPGDLVIGELLGKMGIYHTCFCEAFGFLPMSPEVDDIPFEKSSMGAVAGAGHALHTTRADGLQAVKAEDRRHGLPFSIHMAEHEDETGMLMGEKTGFYNLLKANNMLGTGYLPPMKTPVEYARDLGLLDSATLVVHCVHVTDRDIEILAHTGTHVCLCPRSNEYIGVGRAPWEKILAAGIGVSLGTDSPASNHDLNLWNELSFFIRQLERDLSTSEAITLITHNPAKALLMGDRLGTLEKGKVWRYAVMPEKVSELLS